ncbi:ABC transporter substrate-binding protein [Ignisphaera sp. 4213-co]|uniref:ABC transporter substrate-binding protein n=1 Tax=Ignisphaera cupida TaxID=3050454 RepID=A0ABD4Z6I8_9CREN|nr:ABC transporter substrate-binding protein [Ignisphaera sp. 4213-co]MDK6028354.1 ABC transporter substrate-binding protein [Ignisphaera sp. 4213-co]
MEIKTIALIVIALIIGIAIGYTPIAFMPKTLETITIPVYETVTYRETVVTTVTQVQQTTVSLSWPRKVVDALGREITFDAPPQRVVSTIPSITENLFALGVGTKVIGVDQYSNYPPEVLDLINKGSIAVVGKPWTLDIEKIAALKPDIVFMCRGVKPQETQFAPKLEEMGIKTFFLTCDTAKDQYDIYKDLRLLGQIFGVEQKAEEVISNIDKKISSIINKLVNVSRPRVLQLAGPPSWGLWSAGGDTFIGWLIKTAGGSNIASTYSGWPQLSYEYILSKDPEVIIITAHDVDAKSVYKEVSSSPLVNTTAWKKGRVYLLTGEADDVLSRPGPRIAEALEILAKIIHPEIFGEITRSDVTNIVSMSFSLIDVSGFINIEIKAVVV